MMAPIQDVRLGVRCLELGADRYLLKPIDPTELEVSCRKALERRELELALGG